MSNEKKATPLGGRVWLSALFFGLVGQIAWVVENMYFATLSQDIFAASGRHDLSYIVTTLMVIFSALTATATTIWAGSLCDRVGRRRPFVAYGYLAWGLTILLFALLPMRAESSMLAAVAAALVALDCLMTFAGSTANDAAFNAWVADNTDPTNRGKLNAILSTLPVLAVVLVFLLIGPLYNAKNESNASFFITLGIIPMAAGLLALLFFRDAPTIERNATPAKDTFYGFRPAVVRENPMMYVCLAGAALVGISQQTFFSYLINFVVTTLGFGDGFVIPMAVIIPGAAIFTGLMGVLYDRFGRFHFYLPLLGTAIIGILSFYCLQFTEGVLFSLLLFGGGVLMMGSLLSLTGALTAAFQDYIPAGYTGRFQGVRMCFTVLIPMIVGPIISLCIGLDAMGINGESFTPPYAIFLAAAIVALPAAIPLLLLRKREK